MRGWPVSSQFAPPEKRCTTYLTGRPEALVSSCGACVCVCVRVQGVGACGRCQPDIRSTPPRGARKPQRPPKVGPCVCLWSHVQRLLLLLVPCVGAAAELFLAAAGVLLGARACVCVCVRVCARVCVCWGGGG